MNSSRLERILSTFGVWITLLAAFAATWFAARGFPAGNNLYHVPIVLDYAGSAEGPHDTFHVSLSNFISYFWQAVALVSTQDNVRAVFLVLLFAGSMATTLGAYAIAISAGARRSHAAAGAGFLAFAFAGRDIMEFGGGELFSGFLTHSQFATAISLFAVALAVRRHWRWAALVCGLAANVNLFLGFWLTLTLLLAIFLDRREEPRKLLIECVVVGAVTLITTLPTLIWLLQTMGPKDYAEFSFTAFLYETFPYHSFIHLEVWYAIAFIALSATTWLSLVRLRESEVSDPLALIILSAVLALVGGSFAMYLSDDRMLQNLYPLRYAALVHWFTAAGVIVVWSRAEKGLLDNAVFGAIAVLGFALPTPAVTILGLLFLLDSPVVAGARRRWVMLAAFVVTLILPAFTDGRVELPKNLGIGPLPVLAVICVGGSMLLSVCRHRFSQQSWMPIVLLWLATSTTLIGEKLFAVTFALAIAGVAALVLDGRHRRATMSALGIVTALMIVYFTLRSDFDKTVIGSLVLASAAFVVTRIPLLRREWMSVNALGTWVLVLTLAGLAFGARLGFDFPRYAKDENWFAAQTWARENTPPDTLFYAPARIGFAVLARRPLWWDEDEYAAVMWSPGFYHQWKERRLRADATKTLDDLLKLAREYDIRYLVLKAAEVEGVNREGLEVKYCNPDYCIAAVS